MRRVALSFCLGALVLSQPVIADPQLAPGRPAGVHNAQASNLLPVYGGLALFAVILYATIITAGSAVPASPTSTLSATSTG
jgi:hypothetical protein